ncbi:MAG: hypothetical protein OXG15_02260 [Gammaproteobacteria bacterium]|nr:hypothetical protein [Gammaproteobacteria bacterium]
METLGEFLVPVYTFLAVAFAGWFVVTVYAQINTIRPSRKFARLESEIYLRMYSIVDDEGDIHIEVGLDALADLESLRHKLANMGIGLPPVNESDDLKELHRVLLTLLAYAKDGRIKEARTFTAKWS